MLGLMCEIGNLRLTPFALRYILKAVDRAYNLSRPILDCFNVNERDATRAVRSLNVDFLSANGNASAQHIGHRALIMRE
jgi:hypothetical protein